MGDTWDKSKFKILNFFLNLDLSQAALFPATLYVNQSHCLLRNHQKVSANEQKAKERRRTA